MPFALLFIGVVLLVAGVRNTQDQLFTLVKGDFTGQNNFLFWVVSLLAIGAVGYIPKLKPISTAFLALVIVILFLSKGQGFFTRFNQALGLTTVISPDIANPKNLPTDTNTPIGNTYSQYLAGLQPLGGIQ